MTSAQPAAIPWYALLGTTRRALSDVPKIPRQTSWRATSPGRSAQSTQSSHVTDTPPPRGRSRRTSPASCPSPTSVTSRPTPLRSHSARARAMTGAPCSGVKSPKNTTLMRPSERARPADPASRGPSVRVGPRPSACASDHSNAACPTDRPDASCASAARRRAAAAGQAGGAPTGTTIPLPRCRSGIIARCSGVSTMTTSAAARADASSPRRRRPLTRPVGPPPARPRSAAVSEAKTRWSRRMRARG